MWLVDTRMNFTRHLDRLAAAIAVLAGLLPCAVCAGHVAARGTPARPEQQRQRAARNADRPK